jgi:hypothetical protein
MSHNRSIAGPGVLRSPARKPPGDSFEDVRDLEPGVALFRVLEIGIADAAVVSDPGDVSV